MADMSLEFIRNIGVVVFVVFAVGVVLGVLSFLYLLYGLKRLNIPPDATFSETLRLVPLSVVLAIDLLDFGLDILAAPVSWLVLDRLGLRALRNVATVEALIPGTQIIPTLTLCWFGVRFLGIR